MTEPTPLQQLIEKQRALATTFLELDRTTDGENMFPASCLAAVHQDFVDHLEALQALDALDATLWRRHRAVDSATSATAATPIFSLGALANGENP